MSDFTKFRDAVNRQLDHMSTNELFVADATKDELWDTYIQSFPEGTNPMFRERTEHDCNCCQQFIRTVGHIVSIGNNDVSTVWDIEIGGTYQVVADALAQMVRSKKIRSLFRHDVRKVGVQKNFEIRDDGNTHPWEHFYTELPQSVVPSGRAALSIARIVGDQNTTTSVLLRSLREISSEAIDIVEELIQQNSLYRGEEHLPTIKKLKMIKRQYDKLNSDRKRELFVWKTAAEMKEACRFRNTVIGTLLTDISDGVDLERAVKSFEQKVAPHNYKRSTALITGSMIKKAEEKVAELGIEDALHRRFATPSDLTINNVLFADRSTRPKMGGVFDDLEPTARDKTPNLDKVQDIGINEFVEKVLPQAEKVEVFVRNNHTSNLVSLIAPVHEDAKNIFKWGNNFSWAYDGDVTDSIKEKVKRAGGNVTGDVRVSLSWFNTDDLDIHVKEPKKSEIFFGRKKSVTTGGHLDVDMNVHGESTDPVENVVWPSRHSMVEGDYEVIINNFTKRNTVNVGFIVEVEYDNKVETFVYEKAVRSKGNVKALTLHWSKKNGLTHTGHLESSHASKDVWGISTEKFQKVQMVMNSPNHWDGEQTGNKHWFFMLDGCQNPENARGFYNEFLTNDLMEHRKVFEVLGSKMKAEPTQDQLSGLGFSSTQSNSLLCRVTGSFNRILNIKF